MKIPHPIPYQGSKRNLAAHIMQYFPRDIDTLIEPFAGSAALSLAAAAARAAKHFHLNDVNKPLIDLWRTIITRPDEIASRYASLWKSQHANRRAFYDNVRDGFNKTGRPDYFLYLLARCVKGSVRYNANGEFNQSPDNRRNGMRPSIMREQITGASNLLRGKVHCTAKDYKDIALHAAPSDVIYMDPPYQGVCGNRDTRYFGGIDAGEFIDVLDALNKKNLSFIVSYDGSTGGKTYGKILPPHLNLKRIELIAGRSTQHTLIGNVATTIESLYISSALQQRLEKRPLRAIAREQLSFANIFTA